MQMFRRFVFTVLVSILLAACGPVTVVTATPTPVPAHKLNVKLDEGFDFKTNTQDGWIKANATDGGWIGLKLVKIASGQLQIYPKNGESTATNTLVPTGTINKGEWYVHDGWSTIFFIKQIDENTFKVYDTGEGVFKK